MFNSRMKFVTLIMIVLSLSANICAVTTDDSICYTCTTSTGIGASLGALFSNFDTQPFTTSILGTTWFSYNDAAGRYDITSRSDYTNITKGAVEDPLDSTVQEQLIINGNGSTANGAALEFTLGKQFYAASSMVLSNPFGGVGVRLTDDNGNSYNLDTDSTKGFYFEYRLSGAGISVVRFEVRAYQPNWPPIMDMHRVWWSVYLPATGGVWKGAKVLLSDLVMPKEGVDLLDSVARILNKNEMIYLQWSVSGTPGSKGALAIDNVYFTGAKKLTPLGTDIKFLKTSGSTVLPLKACVSHNTLFVSLPIAHARGEFSLVAVNGATVLRSPITSNSIRLNISNIAKGVYFAVVNLRGTGGILETGTQRVPLY